MTGRDLAEDYVQLAEGQAGEITAIPVPMLDRGSHLSYAFQWIAFGIMAPLGLGYFIWAEMKERRRVRREEAEEEEDLGDVPDDFLDPLLATLMKDPVRLPSSRAVVDRSTIKAHLLSDGTDPFNRMPLKLEDVIPADDVREQIEAWIKALRASSSPT